MMKFSTKALYLTELLVEQQLIKQSYQNTSVYEKKQSMFKLNPKVAFQAEPYVQLSKI